VLAGESVSAGEGLTGSTDLGLVARQDQSQSQQVSYRGWPLYYYVGDTTAGEMGGTEISGMFVTVSPEVEGTGNGGAGQGGG
jgi:predicted lipoprotein with Yx(FWY)xxD motif